MPSYAAVAVLQYVCAFVAWILFVLYLHYKRLLSVFHFIGYFRLFDMHDE